MTANRLIVVGASMGGVEALRSLVAALPEKLPAAVLVVLHLSPEGTSRMPEILSRAGKLPARHPEDKEALKDGVIYVAPPDFHLHVGRGVVRVTRGPKENNFRPAVDVLFRSAAKFYGPAAIGVVLTGTLDCGTAGLSAIKNAGGIALVQDPDDAAWPDMPRNALEVVKADHVAKLGDIGPLLVRLVTETRPEPVATPEPMKPEAMPEEQHFSCPACGGVLHPRDVGKAHGFACQVGHVYSPVGLESAQEERLEAALWTALRTLEERADLAARLGRRSGTHGHGLSREGFEARAKTAQEQADLIRAALKLPKRD